MSEGFSGWYGLLAIIFFATIILTGVAVFGAAALRLMLRDDYWEKP